MSSTEEKLDELIRSVATLTENQRTNQRDLDAKLRKLEKDVTAAQEDATERALKRAKRDRPVEFKRKGHQEQYTFNEEVEDRLEAATKKIKKLAPTATDGDSKKFLQEALDEFKEGQEAIAERQKHIHIADQSEYHWRTVEAYKVGGLGDNEEDAKRIKEAERDVAQQMNRDKRKPSRVRRPQPSPPPPPMLSQWAPGVPQLPQQMLLPPLLHVPPRQPGLYKPPGPCFNCYEVGHLKANCPKLRRPQYPFYSSCDNAIIDTACGKVLSGNYNNTCVTVCGNVANTSCNNLISTLSGSVPSSSYVKIKVTTCENVSSNHDTACYGTVGVVSTSMVNVLPKVTIAPTNAGVNVVSHMAAVCHSITFTPPEAMPTCSSSAASNELVAHNQVGSTLVSCPSDVDVDGVELQDPTDVQTLTTFWEVEEGQTQVTDVQGHLKKSLSFWENTLDPAPWIISCIKEGYKLPLRSIPDRFYRPNQKSALSHKEFVTQAIQELEKNRCVVRVQVIPFICSPLSVVANTQGKLRLVLNLRYLNQFLWTDRFKYEDLRVAMLMFQKGDYLFSFDLKSGYHNVDIYEPHRKYLGFSWVLQGVTQFYVFTVLPFGLSTACYTFTKLLRPLIKYWRGQGLRALLYLDDGIVAVKGKKQANEASNQVRQDLVRAGLVEHEAKCSWVPSQQAKWLGFKLDLQQGVISVPEEKITALRSEQSKAATKGALRARELASIIGKIIAMSLAIGPVSRLMTRQLYALLNSRTYWCQLLEISPEAKVELEFWINQVELINGREIWHSPSALRVVYSDASGTGYGGFTVEHGCHIAHGAWSEDQIAKSSTWRELRAVRMVLESLIPKLKNERVRWFSDNQNVVRIMEVGSRKPELQDEAFAIFSIAAQNLIRIEPQWIPRSENQRADYLSRLKDTDDWMIQPSIFAQLDRLWGPHTIDRFANQLNSQLARFNSRWWCPNTEAVDAFTCDWGGDVNWVCLPPCLIPRCIRHAGNTHAVGTLIFPCWPSAPYWPMLYPDGHSTADFVTGLKVFQASQCPTLPGRMGSSLPGCDMLAVWFDFNTKEQKA